MAAQTGSGGEAALHLDPTSRAFDAKSYIRRVYADATHVEFEQTLLQAVSHEAEVAGEALQQLIRDSMGTFIGCKEAMDVMYANDTSLFTGEAVEPIADAFVATLEDSEELVAPTVELFEELRANKLTKETLARLMVVWRVPGAIYEYCGVRVPQRRSDLAQQQRLQGVAAVPAKSRGDHLSHRDGGEDGSSSSGGGSDGEGSDVEDSAVQRIARGALEEFADGAGTSSDYVLHPGEELLHWHGTPLARRRGGSRAEAARRSNYEAAVLSLRRAMLYLEENYDLENAAVLGVVDNNDDGDENYNSTNINNDGKSNAPGTLRQQRGGLVHTYHYALALLRAALYLGEQMARELRYANAADTVLIEDTLSSMMDTAIAAVKLRHFCWTARTKLQLTVKRDAALSGLRQELREGGSDEQDDDDDGELSNIRSLSGESFAGTDVSSSCITLNPPTTSSVEQQQRVEHPVEYYVRITRNQHTRMMEATALRLSHEANEWRRKFKPGSERVEDATTRDDVDMSGYGNSGKPAWTGSFAMSGMLLGSANDSFSLFNTDVAAAAATTTVAASADATVSERIKVGGFGVDVAAGVSPQVEAILEAFRTPEGNFARFTTFSIGGVDMGDVLECSAVQLEKYGAGLLQQLVDRADVEVSVPAQAAAVAASTFAGRLFAACVEHLELVVVSYWGGIAAAVHAGVFDFVPDADSALHRMLYGPAVLGGHVAASGPADADANTSSNDHYHNKSSKGDGADELPRLTYVPVVQEGSATLRQQSVEAVRKSVKAAGDILYALLLTSVNRTVLRSFVHPMASYRGADVEREGAEEHVELHAAILVEVILAQWETAMTHVSDAVRRMKMVVGESCTSASVVSETQAQEVGELLEELEQLRSNLFRCYTHGVGMLAKAYVTLMPSLRRTTTTSSTSEKNNSNNKNGGLCARVSRDFVSSVLVNKLLNLLSVVVDRTAPFLQRYDEVYDGIDFFAAKAEGNEVEKEDQQQHGRRLRVVRHKPSEGTNEEGQLDPVTAFMAQCNSKMVLDHVAEQEEALLALVANILLVFVDALHHNCQRVSLDAAATLEVRELAIIDSLADALCLPAAAAPLIASELVTPCILHVVVRLTPDAKTPHERDVLLSRKEAHFRTDYLTRVEEHCQLVVDAMLGMFLATPQQRITREVRASGFMTPRMDWQRVSALTAGTVRPYIADSIMHIARAHERLQLLRQPLLGAAVTQRLVAHLAVTFVTALTSDGNAFEISLDCSANFLLHGLLLIEAEGRTLLGIVDALVESIAKNPRAGAVLPELGVAREVLQGAVAALRQQGNAVCEALAARKPRESISNNENSNAAGEEVLAVRQREARCEAVVQSAMRRSRSIVQAIVTYVEDSAVTAAFQPLGCGAGSGLTESVAERLAKRSDGYRLAHTAQRRREKHVKVVKPETEVEGAAAAAVVTVPEGEAVEASAPARKVMRKKGKKTMASAAAAAPVEDSAEAPAAAVSTPRTMERASVLQRAAEQEGKRASVTAALPSGVDTDGQYVEKDGTQEKNNNNDGAGVARQAARKKRGTRVERRVDVDAGGGTRSDAVNVRRFKRALVL